MSKNNFSKEIKFGNRQERQNSENAETVKTDMPGARFQTEKQVLTPEQLGGLDSPVTGTAGSDTKGTAAREIKSSISIRPAASVEMLENKQVGGIPLGGGQVTRNAAGAGGGAMSVSDDTSRIPYQGGNYRPDTRYGKKRSEDLFELDNTVSEQIVPVVEDALDLREAPDAKMGYNGRKQFKQVRSKKNTQGNPQTLLYEGSVDLELHSFDIASTGQVLDNIEPQAGYPTRTYDVTADDGVGAYADITQPMGKSNYRLEEFEFTIEDGRLSGIRFLETEVPSHADTVTLDEANHNWQVDANNVTKTMIRLQTELGRETTDKWSPLGYVIDQPYQYNMLMHDIEATTGAIAATAYRAACSSMAAQRNIISKDGIGTEAAANRMFVEGCLGSLANSTVLDGTTMQNVFNRGMYRRGSAAAIIDMFDSVRKYRTKADILGMQRSLSLHLSQADNNLDPLHVKPQFMRVLDKAHLFSTEDGAYNPLLPIHATRKINLINPLSLNYFLVGWQHPRSSGFVASNGYDAETGLYSPYTYSYADIRNRYNWTVYHPLVSGLVAWMLKHEGALVRTYGDDCTVRMPASFDFFAPSMFQFMVCSALQLINLKRNQIFRDILFAGEQSSYVWDDLVDLGSNDPLHSTQLTLNGYNEAIKMGKMAPDTALRIYWSDNITRMATDSNNSLVLAMPWYMNEQSFTPGAGTYTSAEGWKEADTAFNMSIPSIRSGIRHSYVDIIKSMSENDVRLAMDRMLDIPRHAAPLTEQDDSNEDPGANFVAHHAAAGTNAQVQDNTSIAALRYDVNSDGRVIVQYDTDWSVAIGGLRYPTSYSALAVPKELGWIWSGMQDAVKVIDTISFSGTSMENGTVSVHGPDEYDMFDDDYRCGVNAIASTSSNEIRSYRVRQNADNAQSIDRSAALSQCYRTAYSNPYLYATNLLHANFCGVAVNLSYDDGYDLLPGVYSTRGAGASTGVDLLTISSRARTIWSALQRCFHPVNPFENCYDDPADIENPLDPLEGAFYFGVCGFLASDYTQAVLERLDTFDQLGLDYTEDVNTKESLLFR